MHHLFVKQLGHAPVPYSETMTDDNTTSCVSLSMYVLNQKHYIIKRTGGAKVDSLKKFKSFKKSDELTLFLGLSTELKH